MYNWNPGRVAFLDFETQSRAPLDTAQKYAKHPSTRILTACVKVDGRMHRLGPYPDPADLAALTEGCTVVAHNAPFDSAVWNAAKLPPREWFDTLMCARAAGLPGKLDDLGTLLDGRGKDPNGKRLVEMLCILKGPAPAVGPAHRLLLDYNERDVELLEIVYERVRGHVEPEVMSVDRVINDRGIPIDGEYLRALRDLYTVNAEAKAPEVRKALGSVNPGSPKQMKAWMQGLGFNVPGVNKTLFKDFQARPETYFVGSDESEMAASFDAVMEAMAMRREVVHVGKGKADAAWEALEDDGRARDQFVYYGAHTGRWSGRKIQMHNMPATVSRDVFVRDLEPTYGNVVAATEEANRTADHHVAVADVLNAMLRHMVRAPVLSVADYSAVEARCLAWFAGCQRLLTLYNDPKGVSPYVDLGSKVFGRTISKKADAYEYNFSKQLVLGCGYGMSGPKFEYMCKLRSISVEMLAKYGLKGRDAVKLYREMYPEIPALWRSFHEALHGAVAGTPHEVAGCCMYMDGADLMCTLPSGRSLVYRNARVEERVPGYCKMYSMPEVPVPTVIFDLPKMHDGYLYGARMAENVVQATCRDVIAEALVESERSGLTPCLHVHDEVGAETDRLEELLRVMSTPPAWAEGFPLLVEGYTGPIWTKQTKGYREAVAFNGRVL